MMQSERQVPNQYQQDFGGFYQGKAKGISQPQSVDELQAVLRQAKAYQQTITPRCYGLSQSGQALAPADGWLVDVSALQNIRVDEAAQCAHVQPGASWRGVFHECARAQLTPAVVPFNMDLSIGGVLAAGGIGAASPQAGAVSAHVNACEVMDVNGHAHQCQRNDKTAIAQTALATNGQFSILTQATLALRPLLPRVRRFCLMYTDQKAWLADQFTLQNYSWVSGFEAFASACPQGARLDGKPMTEWFYALQIACEFENDAPDLADLHELHYWRCLHKETVSAESYIFRHDPRFVMMRSSGDWQQYHPWFEGFIDADILSEHLSDWLAMLPSCLGGICFCFPVDRANAPSWMMFPDSQRVMAMTLLPPGLTQRQLMIALPALEQLDNAFRALGGKRYLSGYYPQANWGEHYGQQYSEWCAHKQLLDPQQRLVSQAFSAKVLTRAADTIHSGYVYKDSSSEDVELSRGC